MQIENRTMTLSSLSLPYSVVKYQGINEIVDIVCKTGMKIKELNIELDDKATKTDKGRIESNCGQLIRQYQLSFPIILNGLVIGQMEGEERPIGHNSTEGF